MNEFILVATGGALGAVARYITGLLMSEHRPAYSTLVVNVVGSFILGYMFFSGADSDALLFIGVGICGAFTTYSSFSFQTVELWRNHDPVYASMNAAGNLFLCGVAMAVAAYLV